MESTRIVDVDIDYVFEAIRDNVNDETDNSSYEFGLNSSNFGDLLSSIDQKIQKGPSQLDTSTTTEQIRQVLSELVETVQTRQNLLEQRFDASFQETSVNRSLLPDTSMTNCSLHDSSNLPMFNISIDPKGILTSGRKLLENASSLFSVAPTAKKNVSFLPVNRLSVSSAGSASNFTIFDSPDVRRSFHRSPVCTPHHLRPPLFSHNSGRSVSATLSPQSERSFQENDANLSKVSSVDDFADALEITDFANEEEILNALERSRLIDPTMSFCPSPDSFTSSPEKSFFDSDDSNKQKLQDLLDENKLLKESIERMQQDVATETIHLKTVLVEREKMLDTLKEEKAMLAEQIKKNEEQTQDLVGNRLMEVVDEVEQRLRVEELDSLKQQYEHRQTEMQRQIESAAAEIKTYKQQVAANQSLMQQFEQSRIQNEEKDVLIRSLGSDKNQLIADLESCKQRLELEQSTAQQRLNALSEQQSQAEIELNDLRSELDCKQKEGHEELKQVRNDYDTRIDQLNEAIDKLKLLLDQSVPQNFYSQLKQELSDERMQVEKFIQEIQGLKQTNYELAQRMDQAFGQTIEDQLNGIVDSVQQQVDVQILTEKLEHQHQETVKELQNKLTAAQTSHASLKQQIELHEQHIDELKKENDRVQQELQKLTSETAVAESELGVKHADMIASLRNEVKVLENIRDEEKKTHMELRDKQKQNYEEELELVQNELSAEKCRNEALEKEREVASTEQNQLKSELTKTKRLLGESNAENAEITRLVKQQQEKMAVLTVEVVERDAQIQQLSDDKNSLEEQLAQLRKEMDELLQKLSANQSSHDMTVAELEQQLTKLIQERDSLDHDHEKKMEEMRAQIERTVTEKQQEQKALKQMMDDEHAAEKQKFEKQIEVLQLKLSESVPTISLKESEQQLLSVEGRLQAKETELNETVARYEDKISSMQQTAHNEQAKLKDELLTTSEKLVSLTTDFEKQVEKLTEEYEQKLARTSEDASAKFNQLENEYNAEKKELMDKLNQVEQETVQQLNATKMLEQQLETARNQFEMQLNNERELLRTKDELVQAQKHELQSLIVEIQCVQQERDARVSKEQVIALQDDLSNRLKEFDQQADELKSVLSTKIILEAEIQSTRQQCAVMEGRIEHLKAENVELSGKMNRLMRFEQQVADLEQQLTTIQDEKQRNTFKMALIDEQTQALQHENETLKQSQAVLSSKLQMIEIKNQKLLEESARFAELKEENEVLMAELRLERNNSDHLMHQAKLTRQAKSQAEKEKKMLLAEINQVVNSSAISRETLFDFLFALKDKLAKDPNEDAQFKRPSGKAFLQNLVKKPLNTNN